MVYLPSCLAKFFDQDSIPKEWFCVIAEIANGTRVPIDELASAISGTGCLSHGEYVLGEAEIPVWARTIDDWVSVIHDMCRAGLVEVVDESVRRREFFHYFATAAALRPIWPFQLGEIILTRTGYGYWVQFLTIDGDELSGYRYTWDGEDNRIVFTSTLDLALKECPLYGQGDEIPEECQVRIIEGEPSCPIAEVRVAGDAGCTVQKVGPYWRKGGYSICKSGFMVRCPLLKRGADDNNDYS